MKRERDIFKLLLVSTPKQRRIVGCMRTNPSYFCV